MVQNHKTTEIGLLVVGLAIMVSGILMSHFWELLIQSNFERELALKPGSKSFEKWRLTPLPILMNIYFWNWTNPEDLHNPGYKPVFVEMGPYAFRESHEKVNITWNENGTITYKVIKRWYFDQERTNGSLSDNVTSINTVAASAAFITKSWTQLFVYPLSMILSTTGQQISWTRNVSQLLFEGFENPLQKLNSIISENPNMDKFGYFYNRNGSVSADTYSIDTGINDISGIGALRSWNFQNVSEAHTGSCSEVMGYSGEFWPPNRTKDTPLDMYTTDMCRKISYYYERESSYDGIPTLVFAGTKETVDNGTLLAKNKCYCKQKICPPSGVFDVSSCQQGAPIFMSYPHFYNADSSYADAVVGMSPSQDRHKFYIALEPRTGVQLDVAARLQINVLLSRNPSLSMFKQVPEIYIPVLWIENRASLSSEFTYGVQLLLTLLEVGPFIWYGIGSIGFALVVAVFAYHLHRRSTLTRLKRNFAPSKEKTIKAEEMKLRPVEGHIRETVEYVMPEEKTAIHS